MANFYTNEQKARGLAALIENFGNISRASKQTGISKSTLERWRSEYSPTTVLLRDENQNSLERTILARIVEIRNDLVEQIQALATRMRENPELFAELSIVYARLIDRLIKVQEKITDHSFQIIILYEDPEGFVRELSDDVPF